MAIKRLDHISIVVDDLASAVDFFTALGMTKEGEARVEGPWVDRVNDIASVQVDIVMMRTPDGRARLDHEYIQTVAECKNGREAIDYLQAEPIDLLFSTFKCLTSVDSIKGRGERLQRTIDRVKEKIAAKAALLTRSQLAEVLDGLRNASDEPRVYPTAF